MGEKHTKRLVVAVTGASGSILALDLLRQIKTLDGWESHVVVSPGADLTQSYELPGQEGCFKQLADQYYDHTEIGAAIASGSFKTQGMVVVPCSMKTLAGINSGYSDNLILRAADVTIKERRPLVLVARETPLSPIHLRNMAQLAAMGVVLLPPMMSFYNNPGGIDDMVRHISGKILDVFHEEAQGYRRWK